MMTKKIALLEISKGHTEVLYSQALFLKSSSYEVHLLCSKTNEGRVRLFDTVDFYHFLDDKASRFSKFQNIKKYLKENSISTIVINTASWSVIRYLPFLLWGVQIIGILHGLEKITKSFSQKILSLKINKYFVLSDHLLKQCPKLNNIQFSSFYSIFFPHFDEVALPLSKNNDFWICIPGQVEYKRRDYNSLMTNLNSKLDKRIKFILLGQHNHPSGDGKHLQETLRLKGLEDRFIFFDQFIDDSLFHMYLQKSDILMPLVFASSRYFNLAISGTFNLSYAHKKPQLIHKSYQVFDEFQSSSFFYSDSTLVEILNNLCSNPAIIQKKTVELINDPRFTLNYQAKKYVDFIES